MSDVPERLTSALADRYRIEREIGQGGMATVYLAHDLRHHRPVALKVLRAELAAILGAGRFLKEIEVTANLQHPNILPLYDSGEADGLLYYVMPFVEGESLKQRLDREQQLPVEEVVEIAKSVAAALDYAHRHGVIHRDIKPSNILLQEGQALVADFGIALAMRRAGGESRLTETGLSVGTPNYMSPEQATGDRELDARSDIYSLGATTYEMLVGEPPYVAKTPQAVVAKILSDTPAPVRRARDLVPENVEAAVAKALARSPADRFNSGAEFAAALANPAFTLPALAAATGHAHAQARATFWTRLGPVLAVVALVALLMAARGWFRSEAPPAVAHYVLSWLPGQEYVDGRLTGFDVTRAAAAIVYMGPGERGGGTFRLWVKEKDQHAAKPLAGTEGAENPSISPDGAEVTFTVGTQLRKVSLQGGAPITLADSVVGQAAWLSNGHLVYTKTGPDQRLRQIPASGGVPQETWLDRPRNRFALWPAALPGSRGVLFTLCDSNCRSMDTWVLDLRSGHAKQVVTGALRAWYLEAGYVVFLRPDGAVFAMPFDPGRLEATGPAVPILQGVKIDGFYPDIALQPDGTLLMMLGQQRGPLLSEMVWVSRDGNITQVDSSWGFNTARNHGWSLSPDGTRLAIGLNTGEGDDVWIKELDDGPLLRLTHDPGEDARPEWTTDGQHVYFSSRRGAELSILRADGSEEVRTLVAGGRQFWQANMSPDGAWLLARVGGTQGATGGRDILGYRLDRDTAEVPLLVSEYDEVTPRISPDGRWLAYASNETGSYEVYVRPFPEVNSGKWAVSRGGGYGLRWSRSGREIFYLSADSALMAASVESGVGFKVSARRRLFKLPDRIFVPTALGSPFDVSPDDRRFVMMRSLGGNVAPAAPLILVEHWTEEVKQRVNAQRK